LALLVSDDHGLPAYGVENMFGRQNARTFFNTRMGITPRQYAQRVEALCDSAVAVGHELIEAARNEPHGACGTCARSDGALTALKQAELRDHLDSPSPPTNEKAHSMHCGLFYNHLLR
jgi:hypothetical protein